jgi:predicted transcriptional regulator of viral defense system
MTEVRGLSKASRESLGKLLRRATGTISVGQAAEGLGVPRREAATWLARWASQGWLSRVKRGLYVPVPLEARTTDVALEDSWIVAERLFAPCYIGGWSAAEHWGLTEQIFRSIRVMTTQRPRNRKPIIKGTEFVVRTIMPGVLFGTKSVWRGQVRVNVSDTARTVLDMLDDPALGGGLRPTVDVFSNYLKWESKDLDLLLSYAERLDSGAVFKRLGFLLERFAPDKVAAIERCRGRLTQGYAKLDPSLRADQLVTKWRLWIAANWKQERQS